jgi:hypothetical protein
MQCLRGGFTTTEPESARAEKYDETAVAMIALLKYGIVTKGIPRKRILLRNSLGCYTKPRAENCCIFFFVQGSSFASRL